MIQSLLPRSFAALLGAVTLSFAADAPKDATAPAQPPKPKAPHSNGPEAAAAETAKMTPADGLAVTLFASEPMVVNPTDMDIDAHGRVWVCEGANYRISMHKNWGTIREGGDRIVILEDSNGDGQADKQTVFYQDESINAALGICVLGNRVIVSASPNVFVLTDTDGDLKADKRELLFTDIKGVDHDHAVHAFVFGPDGKMYFNFGNAGSQLRRPSDALKNLPLHGLVDKAEMNKGPLVVDLAGNTVTDKAKPYRQGMAFRCDLDGSNLEVLGHNFRNNYEVCVDSFGTLWQSDNDDDGNRGVRINYVMEFGNFGFTDEMTGANWGTGWKKAQAKGATEDQKPYYHWYQNDPGVVPNLLLTGAGSPTGIALYEGDLLPAVFRNQIFHCDAGPRVTRAYPVKNSGAGYTATMTNLLTSPDTWYRPSDVCIAPDGSVFIADWHDANVGGHNMADRFLESMTGRIYRLAPPGNKPKVPKLDLSTAAGAVAALQSPNLSARYLGWTKLREMGAAAEPALTKLWVSDNPRFKARALHLLARIPGRERQYVEAGLRAADSDLRITALRIARQTAWANIAAGVDGRKAIKESGKKALFNALGNALGGGGVDANQVAAETVTGAQSFDTMSVVRALVNDPSAQVRRECAIALRGKTTPEAAQLWTQLARKHTAGDRWHLEALGIGAAGNEEACFQAWLGAVGDQWNSPAGREIVWRSRSTKAPALLAKFATAQGTSPAEKERYLRAFDFIKDCDEKKAALTEIALGDLK